MQPNILLILVDQWRYDCLTGVHKTPVKLPNIDRLTREGTWFDHAFTPTPVCCPAKQALISGRQADSFGAFWNHDFGGCRSLTPEPDNWVKELRNSGYETSFFAAWHVSANGGPKEFGFDNYTSMSEYNEMVSQKYPGIQYKNGWFGEPNPVPLEDSATHFFADRICSQITNSEKPFFIWTDIPFPHLPCRPSEPFASMYTPEETVPWDSFGDTFENKPYIQKTQIKNWGLEGMTWKDFAPTVALYYGMISQIDDAVGKIVECLEKEGKLEDTMIIFSSDHGDTCGGHGMMDKHYILYDDVTRVPLIIRYPRLFPEGKVCHSFVSNCLDMAPTIEEICDLPAAGERHGESLTKALSGTRKEDFSVSTSNGQQFGLYTNRCIREERFKYIWNLTDIDEFYDLQNDPGELHNLIDEPGFEEIKKNLKEKLFKALTDRNDPFANGWLKKQLCE